MSPNFLESLIIENYLEEGASLESAWIKLLNQEIPVTFECTHEIQKHFGPIIESHSGIKSISKLLSENNAVMAIIEREYVDKEYLSDFQRYHLSCYQHYKKFCLRIHFFNKKVIPNTLADPNIINEFKKLFDENKASFTDKTKNNPYLGFVIIRPLPISFIGRSAIAPVIKNSNEQGLIYLLKQPISVHFLGFTFYVDSLLFIQQDRSVGACSPTALWIALNSLKRNFDLGQIPSISELTEMNNYTYGNYNRTFPNLGLYIPQLEDIIKQFNLEPDYYYPKQFFTPNQLIQSYIKGNIPVLIVIEWWKSTKLNSKDNLKVQEIIYQKTDISHMVVITGFKEKYRLRNSDHVKILADYYNENPFIISESIDFFYIHDDNIGPYQKAELIEIIDEDDEEKRTKFQLNYSELSEYSNGIWILSDILIPSHPKIRVSFDHAKNLIANFLNSLNLIKPCNDFLISSINDNEFAKFHEILKGCDNDYHKFFKKKEEFMEFFSQTEHFNTNNEELLIDFFDSGENLLIASENIRDQKITWSMYITTCNDYKEKVRSSQKYDEHLKLQILHKPLPRFLWIYRAFSLVSTELVGEIIIDATDFDPPYSFYSTWFKPPINKYILNIADKYTQQKSWLLEIFSKEDNQISKKENSNSQRWYTYHLEPELMKQQIIREFYIQLKLNTMNS